MIHATIEASAFALEITTCPTCGHLLSRYEFGFDWLGRTMSLCPSCGPSLLKLRVGAPPKRVRKHPEPKIIKGCADCRGWMLWPGVGEKPVRCVECQQRHQRVRSRQYQRDVRAGLRHPIMRRAS